MSDNLLTHHKVFKQIDNALGIYYESMGKANYFDSNKIGRFLQYINNHKLENASILNELQDTADPHQCKYIHFDSEFPIPKFINLQNYEREEFIFYILQYILKHDHPPSTKDMRDKAAVISMVYNEIDSCSNLDKLSRAYYHSIYQNDTVSMHSIYNIMIALDHNDYYDDNDDDDDDVTTPSSLELQSDWEQDEVDEEEEEEYVFVHHIF